MKIGKVTELRRLGKIEWEPTHKDARVMCMDDWVASVLGMSFTDYDGFGHLATDTQISNLQVKPSYVSFGKITEVAKDFEFRKTYSIDADQLSKFTHIVWFNK